MTVAQHLDAGATVQSQTLLDNLWGQTIQNATLDDGSCTFPIYVASSTDPTLTISLTEPWGSNPANGSQIRVPVGAQTESCGYDYHLSVIDQAAGIEFDGWECGADGTTGAPVTASSTTLTCAWGGNYTLGGNGLNGGATHGGFASGLNLITAAELLNGEIAHALTLDTNCLDNPNVYPAAPGTSDQTCANGKGPEPAAHYGQMVHLTWSDSQIAASHHSSACKTVLTALAHYGAYLSDTGNGALLLNAQDSLSYDALGLTNPWFTTLLPEMVQGGDATGSGSSFNWSSCLNGEASSDFELIQLADGGY